MSSAKLIDENVKNWERFPGNNRFCCDGRAMSARQCHILAFLFVLFGVVACLFFAFDARHLTVLLWPYGVVFPIVGVIVLFYSTMFLLKAGCIDPGFIPRATAAEGAYYRSLADSDNPNNPALMKSVKLKGIDVKLKYCHTCNIYRPPRGSHCSICNNCCEHFDHHCPWVGNCVAKRNYRYFYLFLNTILAGCIFVGGSNIATIVLLSLNSPDGTGIVYALKTSPGSILEFLISAFASLGVTGMAGFHTCLIASFQTTNEEIKGTYGTQAVNTENPFHRGNICKNFMVILCGPFPPSLINARSKWLPVEEEVLYKTAQIDGPTQEPPKDFESSTPPLLDGSPLHNRATLTGTEPLSQSLEGIEIGGNTVEVEILPRLTDGPGNSDGSLQDSSDDTKPFLEHHNND